jgi:uncharacterized protein DUF4124
MRDANGQLLHVGRVALVVLILPMVFGLARAGEVYKWVDDSGEVHYSDTLPAGANAQRVPESDPSISIPGTTPPNSTPAAEPAPMEDQKKEAALLKDAERRHKMIEDCERNNGIDCAREVDTELRAEAIQRRGHIIHQMRPGGVRSIQGGN